MSINALHEALVATKLLEELELGDGFISGEATFAAVGTEVSVNVDPDPNADGSEADVELMVERTRTLLALNTENYNRIIGEIAEELESALDEEGLEKVADIRADLSVVSLIVIPEGFGLIVLAPEQLGEAALTVFLDDAFEIEEIQLQSAEGGCGDDCACGSEDETHGTVSSVDELIASLSTEN